MTVATGDRDLYDRGMRTLLASWATYARGSAGAALVRTPGAAAAIFPTAPERGFYNNAVVDRDLGPAARAEALDAVAAAYAAAGVRHYAVWAHEDDRPLRRDLERRRHVLDERTRAMAMDLDAIRLPRPAIDLGPPDWRSYVRLLEMPPTYLRDADPADYHVVVGRLHGAEAATAMALEFEGDCGVYNVGTLEPFRRRGLGTALTTVLVHDARDRGCLTASLQSTPMAERVYAAVGFRDLGRIVEYVPAAAPG